MRCSDPRDALLRPRDALLTRQGLVLGAPNAVRQRRQVCVGCLNTSWSMVLTHNLEPNAELRRKDIDDSDIYIRGVCGV